MLPYALPSPKVCSISCPLSQWCHRTISSSATPFSSCPQSFPASGSILMSWLFASGGQGIGTSASASVLPMNIQGWFPLVLTGLISLKSKDSSPAPQLKRSILWSAFFMVQLSHPYTTAGKAIVLTIWTFVSKVMSLLFNTLSRFVIAFLLWRNHLSPWYLQFSWGDLIVFPILLFSSIYLHC